MSNIVVFLIIAVIALMAYGKAKRNKRFAHWVVKKQIKLSIGTMVNFITKYKIDEKTIDGFDLVQTCMSEQLSKNKLRFCRVRQVEIEYAAGIGLSSYMDLILLYTYVATQDDNSESYTIYREKYMSTVIECLKFEFIPTVIFNKCDFLDPGV